MNRIRSIVLRRRCAAPVGRAVGRPSRHRRRSRTCDRPHSPERPSIRQKMPAHASARRSVPLEICYGSKITDKAKTLGDAYQGADQDAFKAQAAKVYEAWHAVKNCANQRDPNQCKIIMDKSCAIAEAEIGASGSVMPGLVDFMKH